MRAAIVTAADSAYLPMLRGLLASLERCSIPPGFDLCLLDVGLKPEEAESALSQFKTIASAQWDYPFPLQPQTPRWYQALTARPALPRYFPGYDLYLWLDADTWLQDARVLELLAAAALESAIGLVPEIHPMYPYLYGGHQHRLQVQQWYELSYGSDAARAMADKPILNSGAFAMRADSPIWPAYDRWMRAGCQKHPHQWTEQCALNLAIYNDIQQFAPLPAWCNWICYHALPVWDANRRCLCEPNRPYEKLSLIHLTSRNEPAYSLGLVGGGVTANATIRLPLGFEPLQAAIAPSS